MSPAAISVINKGTRSRSIDRHSFSSLNYLYGVRRTFPSAIGWIIVIPMLLISGVIIIVLAAGPGKWPALLVLISVQALIVHLLMTTHYTIDGGRLVIRCGFFYREAIDISSITGITETRNPLSSPALSLNRLNIHYGERGQVMISPKDRTAFIAVLRASNPSLKIDLKNRQKP